MGIRGKLLLLAIGIALPLVLFSALDLRNMWRLSRAQLDESVRQQVDLASIALERWLDDQRKALAAISALASDNDTRSPAINDTLENVLRTRPFWMDLRITNAAGTTIMAQPSRKVVLTDALTDHLVSEMREGNSLTVVADRTVDEARPIIIVAVPIQKGGAVISRIDGAAINQLFDSIKLSRQVVISVMDSDGRVLYRRRGSQTPTEVDVTWSPLSSVLSGDRTNVVELTSPIDGIKRVYGVAQIRDTGLITMIGIPSSTLYEPARRRVNRYALIGLFALMIAIGAALVIERSVVLPVRRLRAAAQQLGAGDLTARAPIEQVGEIGDLTAAFNSMAARIKEREERLNELDQLKSDFVSSVSHELKTPLTTIKVLAHLLQRNAVSGEERIDYSKTIAAECDRQIDFVGNLLDLSRIEAGAYKLNNVPIEIRELVQSSVDTERYRAESLGLRLVTSIPLQLPLIKGDFEALSRVIRGLVDNALKNTPEGGHVEISARVNDQTIAIEIEDTGRGIPPSDLPQIFDRFYRAGSPPAETDEPSSPPTSTPGVGLGLYLARHIIEQSRGRIMVESEVGSGTVFRILLPISDEDTSKSVCNEVSDVEAIISS